MDVTGHSAALADYLPAFAEPDSPGRSLGVRRPAGPCAGSPV